MPKRGARRCASEPRKRPRRPRQPAPRIVALDNDECLGSFGMVGDFYCHLMAWLYAHHGRDAAAMRRDWEEGGLRDLVVHECGRLLAAGYLRPGVADYLRQLRDWRAAGELDAVVMYTSASDECWVSERWLPGSVDPSRAWLGYVRRFLLPCIESAADCPGLYAAVLHRNNVRAAVTPEGATVKDVANVLLALGMAPDRTSTRRVAFVDDRPQNIRDGGAQPRPGTVCPVPPYERQPGVRALNVWYRNVMRILEGRPGMRRKFDGFVDRYCGVEASACVSPLVRRTERENVRRLMLEPTARAIVR